MTYSTRLAVALLGAVTMCGADATITPPQDVPSSMPPDMPLSTSPGKSPGTPSGTPLDMPAHAPALVPPGLEPGIGWFVPQGDPWRDWPRDDEAQEFDWAQPQNAGYFPGTPWNAAAGHTAAPVPRRTRRQQADSVPTPVPEPKNYQLLLTGFVLLLLYSGRRVSGPWRLIRVGNTQLGNI